MRFKPVSGNAIRWAKILLAVLASLVIILIFAGEEAFSYRREDAVSFLKRSQSAEGGFAEPNSSPDELVTSWALLAGISDERFAPLLINEGRKAIGFLAGRVSDLTDLKEISLCTIALSAAGVNVRDIQSRNLVSVIRSFISDSGKIGKDVESHCWAVLALKSCGENLPGKCVDWLYAKQREDGGWGSGREDIVGLSALSIQALVATGFVDADSLRKALSFIRGNMSDEGGFPDSKGKPNAKTTALAVMAINATGNDPSSGKWDFHGYNPRSFLESLQAPDGRFLYSKGVDAEPVLTTSMSLIALSGKHLSIRGTKVSIELPGVSAAENVNEMAEVGTEIEAGSLSEAEGEERDSLGSLHEADDTHAVTGAGAASSSWLNGFWIFLFFGFLYCIVLVILALAAWKLLGSLTNRR